jgi:D-sedoheptulose 7-phosphate isomerase
MQTLLSNRKVTLSETDPVNEYLANLAQTISALPQGQIWEVIQVLFEAWKAGKHIFLCGNGGSAATASHMANDLNKLTISPDKPRMKAIALTDNTALMTAWANDNEYEIIFSQQLLNFIQPGDIVIAISTSGNSPNVLRALETAQAYQAKTIGFTGSDGGKLRQLVDFCIFVPDEHMGRQEDCHMILDHLISNTLRQMIADYKD